jgi:glycosyltransferase involved in cell wall biosynthesis
MLERKKFELLTEDKIISTWSNKQDIVLSIICVTFNHAKFIDEAIRGFLIQKTDFAFEVIIHDDASTDKTVDIIKKYQSLYPSIIKPIFQKENQWSTGIFKPVLYASKFAEGQYIARCEGDDYWVDPLKIQIQIDFLEKNNDYVITYTNSVAIDENGILDTDFGGAKKDLSKTELQRAAPIFTLTVCYRNIIKDFPVEMMIVPIGDLFYWSLLGEHGKGKYLANIEPAVYRVHDGGILSKKSFDIKAAMHFKTLVLLYMYHSGRNNKNLTVYYRFQILQRLINKRFAYKNERVQVLLTKMIRKLFGFIKYEG